MTRRERNLARLTDERLKEVFAVLTANCGASPGVEEDFLSDFSYDLESYSSAARPWQFDGYYGGEDGGFYFGADGIPSLCCRFLDIDSETRGMLLGCNRLFMAMVERWASEDTKTRARERRTAVSAAKQLELEKRRQTTAPRERLSLLAS